MKKMIIVVSVLFACATSLPAQITREQADAIVLEHLKSEIAPFFSVFVNVNTPSVDGFVITTSMEETVKAKYACWVYLAVPLPGMLLGGTAVPPNLYRCLFVKEDNGSLLEINAMNNSVPDDLTDWEVVNAFGLVVPKENNKSLYPNPVDDWLTIPCKGENTAVEIYDLKGSRLFSKELSDKDVCRLNVSFLSAGFYMVNVAGETYKMIKN